MLHTCTGSGMQRSIYKTRQMSAEILTKIRNLLVDPFSWNGLKQQLTLVDTHFACTHERTPRETDNNYAIPISRFYIVPTIRHSHCISFFACLFRSLSFILLLIFSFSFHSCQNPDASDGRIDRKKRTLLTVGMIISAPMMLSL